VHFGGENGMNFETFFVLMKWKKTYDIIVFVKMCVCPITVRGHQSRYLICCR